MRKAETRSVPRSKTVNAQRLPTAMNDSGPQSSHSFECRDPSSPDDPRTWALRLVSQVRSVIQWLDIELLPVRAQFAEDVHHGSQALRVRASNVDSTQRSYERDVPGSGRRQCCRDPLCS